jgi:hypothetical protein
MATFQFKGLDTYIKQLSALNAGDKGDIIGKTVYAGAAVVADAVRKSIEDLPVGPGTAKDGELIDTVTPTQKRGLLDGFGISHIQDDDGFLNVKLGFDGYNGTRTKNYPKGQPNVLIARAVNSGTTFRKKTRFVDKAVSSSRKASEKAMDETCNREIEKIMK